MPMTYSSLKNDIQVWAENTGTDFTAQLDTFIGNTQQKLSREIDPTGFNQNVTSSTSIGDRFITLPSAIEPMLLNYLNRNGSNQSKRFANNLLYSSLLFEMFCQNVRDTTINLLCNRYM